jgi:membrane-bound lytic murein transglycosylase D
LVRSAAITSIVFAVACAGGSHEPPVAAPALPDTQVVESPRIVVSPAESAQVRPMPAAVSATQLDKRTAELFGDATRLGATIPVPDDSAVVDALENAPTWDIDVRSYETVDRVRFYVAAFGGNGAANDRFVERLERGTRYESMIRAKLRAGDLPEDMYFLALVESGFNPHAYSSAAAVGMWQFMTSTARGVGLRVDWWVDERRDPVRSTWAAVRFLRGLREQFGSMFLAAAAYNGGPGRISRGLSRYADDLEGISGDDVFFALAEQKYLRVETKDYVPQLVASALVAKEPDKYGIAFDTLESFAYDSARVGPRVPLATIATAAGTSVARIHDLNPHILRGMTPPKDSMVVRIPLGSRERFEAAMETMSIASLTGAKTVKTTVGATWATLAKKGGVSSKSMALYNPTVKPSKKTGRIAEGTFVLVPTPAVVAAALPVPDPSIERYGGSNRTHVVRRGENLSVIAKRYGTTTAAIMRLNRLKKPMIFPGQELAIRATVAPKAKAKASGANGKS